MQQDFDFGTCASQQFNITFDYNALDADYHGHRLYQVALTISSDNGNSFQSFDGRYEYTYPYESWWFGVTSNTWQTFSHVIDVGAFGLGGASNLNLLLRCQYFTHLDILVKNVELSATGVETLDLDD